MSVDVANTSAITDALGSLGKGVEVLSSLVGIHVDATVSVPFEATLAIMAAAQNPELSPNVLSYLVQRFVNPCCRTVRLPLTRGRPSRPRRSSRARSLTRWARARRTSA